MLPDSVLGDAIGCLIYSFLCLIANSLLVWLIWTHNERKTYIAFIAYFTLIATYSSIIQQLYDYIFWRDLMVAQYYYGKDHAEDAEVQYQKGIFGLKLVLSYIRRIVPITLAVIMIILLQLDFTHADFNVYMAIANAQFLLSLVGACIFLLMILFKYMQTRRLLKTWDGVQYGKGGSSTATSGMRSFRSRANSNRNRPTNGSFDNWLVIRLSIAFVMLCVFEYTNVGPRLKAKGHVVESAYKSEPDTSHKRALSSVRGYLSGVSPSLLAFIVFGTTKTFQKKMYKTFVPRFLRERGRRNGNDDDDEMFRCRTPAQMPSSRYSSTTARASSSTTLPPPPSTATTYYANYSPRSLSHQDSSLSMRKPEPAALLSTIPDEPDDFAEVDPRFPRRSQIGMALSKLPTPQRVDSDGYGYGGSSWHDSNSNNNNGPYSPKTPIYSSIRSSHSRNESLPSPRPHSRHHSFSRPTSRSVDHGQGPPPPPTTPRLPTHSIELSRGRSRSRSRSRVRTGGGAFSRDASHDSSSSRVPISRFNSLVGINTTSSGSIRGRSGPGPAVVAETIIDDGASGVSMTTIWSDAPRRGSKHSRI
ncbi:hypothetical protein SLS64_011960 [Diaporthe eres]|uniref:Pheromone receptor n=1 Tax=Diaporthe eres TaxID=83184 RepID=A0ABR1NUH8_DIAER